MADVANLLKTPALRLGNSRVNDGLAESQQLMASSVAFKSPLDVSTRSGIRAQSVSRRPTGLCPAAALGLGVPRGILGDRRPLAKVEQPCEAASVTTSATVGTGEERGGARQGTHRTAALRPRRLVGRDRET